MPRLTFRSMSARAVVLSVVSLSLLAGCTEVYNHGYVQSPDAIAQIQVGSSREQVLLVLGSPSTTSTTGGDAFYYISQKTERNMAFNQPGLVDQRVLAVYFDAKGTVTEVGNFGLQDGKVFDFISRRTKTTGQDYGILAQILKAGPSLSGIGK